MPYVNIADQRLFYTAQRGPTSRPALVLLHGAGGSHLDWPAALRRQPETAVYTIDLPGHGRSAPPGRETIAAYADTVSQLLPHFAHKTLVLTGHSMGGAIAQTIAAQQHPQVKGLVLISTGARLPVSPTLLEQTQTDFDAATDFVARYAWSATVPDPIRQLGLMRMRQTPPAVLHGDFLACDRFDMRDQLHAIRLPTLVLGGTADKMTPFKFSQQLAADIPQAELVRIANAGHMLPLEAETAVAHAIHTFIQQHFPTPNAA